MFLTDVFAVLAFILILVLVVYLPLRATSGLEDPYTERENKVLAVVVVLFMLGGLANHFGLIF